VTRVFGRGQLKAALLEVLDDLGEAHGYAVLRELKTRVGDGWRPSPGAIYPALLALVDSGLADSVRADGTQRFRVTDAGRQVLLERTSALDQAQQRRAQQRSVRHTAPRLGQLLDDFAATFPHRRRSLDGPTRAEVADVLARARHDLDALLTEG